MKRSKFIKTSLGLVAGTSVWSAYSNQVNFPPENTAVKLPKALVRGDLIGITAPAGSIWNKKHIDKIQTILHAQGFKTKLGKTVHLQEGYLAGDDDTRADELMEFYADQSIKGIVTMRGGWGCARILDQLDYEVIKANPKVIIGFSDITSLIMAIYEKTGVITYHGPCGYSSWGDFTMSQVVASIVDGKPYILVNPPQYNSELETLVSGKAQGRLIGGNLTVVTSLIGTNYEPNWRDKLLFLEEIGEEPYRIDRMLWQLKQAGVFNQIKGVIIGSFKNCAPEEPHKAFSLAQVFEQHFKNVTFPVYKGAAFGHITPKFTLPIGVLAEMDADNFTIRTLERSVRI